VFVVKTIGPPDLVSTLIDETWGANCAGGEAVF